ncbi:UDP-2,4-diacetamido-2,4,6-trideoxy-beta-L-altropyranose hydrolase [Tenacibaculum sp. 190524A02b]|uniref:UDP-2,4-diacetamido-2,4, 6-trideoxy-beta-L-altropyranose hydrolase n=1 Tax=Tenacibaculum vairaonense TaxID=3137860 RepID=UPI0032B1B260
MSKSKKILFRADGNSSIGLGHLYRLFSLVEIYRKEFDFIFLTRADSELSVIPKSYPLKLLPTDVSVQEEPEWINESLNLDDFIMVADGYQFKTEYQKKVKDLGLKLIYIDDLVDWHMYADVVINHSLGHIPSDYSSESYTVFGLGTNYAMLRSSFIKESLKTREVKKIDTVFICFGGADPYGLTIKAVEALESFDEIKKINVVIGGAYKDQTRLKLITKDNSQVRIYQNLSEEEMIQLMRESNLALAPSSTILYELCSVKMPILSGFYVRNQERIYNGFLKKNVIFGLGNISTFSAEDFRDSICKFLGKNNYQSYCRAQMNMFKGNIEERFLKIIKK